MNIQIEQQENGTCHLSLSGRISQNTVGSHVDTLSQLLGESNFNQTILVSLREANYIDSSGIGWLLATDKRVRLAGGTLIFHSAPIDVQHVFGLMKLHKVLNIAKDKNSANVKAGDSHGH